MRFRQELAGAIQTVFAKDQRDPDSPVYAFIKNLQPPAVAATVQAMANGGAPPRSGDGGAKAAVDAGIAMAHSMLMQQVEDAQKESARLTEEGKLVEAKEALRRARSLLETVRKMRKEAATATGAPAEEKPEDPYIVQRLALLTYKSKDPNEATALDEASKLLATLGPRTSNDTETLGLWGAVHKRIYALKRDPAALDESVRAYERGFYLRNDYYNGINYAYLLNERAAHPVGFAEAVADFVQARRVRKEVVSICKQWLESNPRPAPLLPGSKYPEKRYWVLATLAEAQIGLEEEALGQQRLEEAFAAAPEEWMKESTQEQVTKLKALLGASPLKKLATTGDAAVASGH